MEDYKIRYIIHCSICDKIFYPNRNHSKTCCQRCRSILFRLNGGRKLFCSAIEAELYKSTVLELKNKSDFVKNAKMGDGRENLMELIFAYKDSKGEIKWLVFRNQTMKYLEVWNNYGEEIKCTFYRF